MAAGGIGITAPAFWAVLLLGLVVVAPLAHSRLRSLALAVLNLGFLLWLQRTWVVVSLGLIAASYVSVLLVARRRRFQAFAYAGAVLAVLALFAAYKAPWLQRFVPSAGAIWLSSLGFSYVALRWLDELASVRDSGAAPNFVEHLNYLVPFHMLAAGPIQRFEDFRLDVAPPAPLTFSEALGGAERIVMGLFKKLVLAHLLERLFLTGFRSKGWYFFLEVQLFLPWLYLDFSSYSDIAVGAGRLLGVRTPENFNRPYLARDLVDFWQRWHISLSEWIRRNVFMPLQMHLQRRYPGVPALTSSSVSLLVAFGLCGLWHTVSLRYGAWGLMHATGVVAANWSRVRLTKKLGRQGYQQYRAKPLPRLLGIAATFEFVAWSLTLVAGRW